MRIPRSLLCLARLAGWLLMLAANLAAAGIPQRFDIPAGDAKRALRQFTAQSGEEILYPADRLRGVRTQPVHDNLTPRAALEQMFAGTGLHVVEDAGTGALAIGDSPARNAAPARPSAQPETAARQPVMEVVRLNPFEVRSDPDEGYGALDSNALTAFRIQLDRMPATTTVFTQRFTDDVAATSVQEVLAAYAGTVGADPNNLGAALAMPGDRDGSTGALGIRGLGASAPKRDGFIGMRTAFRGPLGHTDVFSIERIEMIEGPQSLLYGAVGGGGVINLVSKRATFGADDARLQTRLDRYGGRRAVLDANHGGDHFALRIAAVGERRRNFRYNLGGDFHGLYAQAAFRLGTNSTLRVFGQRDDNWANVSYTPTAADLANFLPPGDARRGRDPRYLALTGQLADLQGRLWDGPVDYQHVSSSAGWWSSERIAGELAGATLESVLGRGFSAQVSLVYSETQDARYTVAKNLVPAAGRPGAGSNPLPVTAIRFTPGDNRQLDRTRGFRATLLHEATVRLGRHSGRAQTALGIEASHQGPAFGSGGIDRLYYLADGDGNVVINPALSLDYGRIPLGSVHFSVEGQLARRPSFRPGSPRVTIDGRNYVLEPRIRQDPARVSAQNPFGLVPNNPTAANPNAFAGQWNRGAETRDRQLHLANYTEWAGGRVTTMVGASIDRFTTFNFGPAIGATHLPPRNHAGYMLGATWALDPAMLFRTYATVSTAGLSAGSTKDFLGQALEVPQARSILPEIGLKWRSRDNRAAAQLAFNPATEVANEVRNAGADYFNAVNPIGINGRHNNGDQWVNLDRRARAIELLVTASPSRHWRVRFSAAHLGGEITSNVQYPQLYNDQFHTRGDTVTYRDGTPVMVDPAAAGGPATTPLTLAALNHPASPYYASPDPNSGRITSPALIAVLTAVDPVRGTAATGVTGLPIGAMQYAFDNPHGGRITVVNAGDKTTGINEFTLNAQTAYSFSGDRMRGLSLFADVRTQRRNRAYYTSYFPPAGAGGALQARRVLYRLPNTTVLGLGVGYERKLGGRTWSTRLNIDNALNHYRVWVMPSPANGDLLNARLSTQPRQFVWTTSVEW